MGEKMGHVSSVPHFLCTLNEFRPDAVSGLRQGETV